MKSSIRHRARGQAIGLAAVVMSSMVGMLALVVDAGVFWETQHELQKSANAASLAGINQLPGDQAAAVAVAQQFAGNNMPIAGRLCATAPTTSNGGITATPGWDPLSSVYTLTVSLQCPEPPNVTAQQSGAGFTFGRILGLFQMTIRANATAAIGSLKKPNCPLPFAISDASQSVGSGNFGYDYGQLVALHVDVATSTYGNFHAIDLNNGTGGNVYRDNLAGQCSSASGLQVPGTVSTEPGDMNGPTAQGLQQRGLVPCSGSGQPELCTRFPALDLACPVDPLNAGMLGPAPDYTPSAPVIRSGCLGIVVVTPNWDGRGRTPIPIEGFAEFVLVGWDNKTKEVWGMFVKGASTIGELGAYDPFGTIVTRLIR